MSKIIELDFQVRLVAPKKIWLMVAKVIKILEKVKLLIMNRFVKAMGKMSIGAQVTHLKRIWLMIFHVTH